MHVHYHDYMDLVARKPDFDACEQQGANQPQPVHLHSLITLLLFTYWKV